MLRDFGIFISLVCLLVSVIIVLNARWVIHCIDNSKDLENKAAYTNGWVSGGVFVNR